MNFFHSNQESECKINVAPENFEKFQIENKKRNPFFGVFLISNFQFKRIEKSIKITLCDLRYKNRVVQCRYCVLEASTQKIRMSWKKKTI